MSRSADRRSPLERGSPETKPRSCGNQSAHESLFNRRLRVLSPAVRTSAPAPSAAAETNNCVRTLESEHENRLLKIDRSMGLSACAGGCLGWDGGGGQHPRGLAGGVGNTRVEQPGMAGH
jgi:hypothetical protein